MPSNIQAEHRSRSPAMDERGPFLGSLAFRSTRILETVVSGFPPCLGALNQNVSMYIYIYRYVCEP